MHIVKMMIFSELGKYFAANGDVSLELAVDEIRKVFALFQISGKLAVVVLLHLKTYFI